MKKALVSCEHPQAEERRPDEEEVAIALDQMYSRGEQAKAIHPKVGQKVSEPFGGHNPSQFLVGR